MRRLRLLIVSAAALGLTAACSLLTDLSDLAGAADAAQDTGVETGGDGGADADAGADASLPVLTCAERAGSRVQLNTGDGGAPLWFDRIDVGMVDATHARVVALVSGGVMAFTFATAGTNDIVETPLLQFSDQARQVRRQPGGFAVLGTDSDPSSDGGTSLSLAGRWIDDTSAAFGNEVALSPPGAIHPDANGVINGDILAVDPKTGDFFVAVLSTEGGNVVVRAQRQGGTPKPLTLVDTLDGGQRRVAEPSIAVTATHAYFLTTPDGTGPGDVTSLFTLSADGTKVSPRIDYVPSDGGVELGLSFGASASPGALDLALLTGDPNKIPLTIEYGVGQLPASALPDPLPVLRKTDFGAIEDVTLDHVRGHLESFTSPATDNLVLTAATLSTKNESGVNLLWFDATTGALHGEASGATRLASDVPVVRESAATFESPPSAALASFVVVFTDQVNQPANLWAMTVSCAP